jgi:hypothetical protein
MHRASGINVLCAAIALWKTVYVEKAVRELRNRGHHIIGAHPRQLSPLGWERIAPTGVYRWDPDGPQAAVGAADGFRPLRTLG